MGVRFLRDAAGATRRGRTRCGLLLLVLGIPPDVALVVRKARIVGGQLAAIFPAVNMLESCEVARG